MAENTMFHVKHTEKQPFVAPFLAQVAEITARATLVKSCRCVSKALICGHVVDILTLFCVNGATKSADICLNYWILYNCALAQAAYCHELRSFAPAAGLMLFSGVLYTKRALAALWGEIFGEFCGFLTIFSKLRQKSARNAIQKRGLYEASWDCFGRTSRENGVLACAARTVCFPHVMEMRLFAIGLSPCLSEVLWRTEARWALAH